MFFKSKNPQNDLKQNQSEAQMSSKTTAEKFKSFGMRASQGLFNGTLITLNRLFAGSLALHVFKNISLKDNLTDNLSDSENINNIKSELNLKLEANQKKLKIYYAMAFGMLLAWLGLSILVPAITGSVRFKQLFGQYNFYLLIVAAFLAAIAYYLNLEQEKIIKKINIKNTKTQKNK